MRNKDPPTALSRKLDLRGGTTTWYGLFHFLNDLKSVLAQSIAVGQALVEITKTRQLAGF